MNRFHFLSLVCFISAAVLFAVGIFSGEVEVGLLVFIPFIMGSGLFAVLGVLLVFFGFVLLMFGQMKNYSRMVYDSDSGYENQDIVRKKESSFKTSGVVLIGPVPIIFGSNWKVTVLLVVLAIVLMLVSYFLFM